MAGETATAPSGSWARFFEDARQLADVDSDALLGLVAKWADAREAESPDCTLPLATWLAKELGLAAEAPAGRGDAALLGAAAPHR